MKLALACFLCLAPLLPAVEVRLSVKFIEMPDGTPPQAGVIGSRAGFDQEVAYGNEVLARTGRGYVLRVVEYVDIQPPPPPNAPADYWYNLDARANSAQIESAAVGNPGVWRHDVSVINLYVNNSSSGQCCGLLGLRTISLGQSINTGTVLHEIGHLMSLRHTHQSSGDDDCSGTNAPLSQHIFDGDGFADTAPDRSCFSQDQLCQALFNVGEYISLTDAQRQVVDSAWFNMMSYHMERDMSPDQMDAWTDAANAFRALSFAVSGRTVFVDRANTCSAGLPPEYDAYAWWVEDHPLPVAPWGQRLPLEVVIDPTPPEPPFGYPPAGPRPPSNLYPSDWPWPPLDLPSIRFCIGGPLRTVSEGMTAASAGDNVLIRTGTYNVGSRLTGRLSLRAARGTVTLRP
jgi:hypothetical protein